MISDGLARQIAAYYHGGRATALCSFVMTGAIEEDALMYELLDELYCQIPSSANFAELISLVHYVADCGNRGPQVGWSEVWE